MASAEELEKARQAAERNGPAPSYRTNPLERFIYDSTRADLEYRERERKRKEEEEEERRRKSAQRSTTETSPRKVELDAGFREILQRSPAEASSRKLELEAKLRDILHRGPHRYGEQTIAGNRKVKPESRKARVVILSSLLLLAVVCVYVGYPRLPLTPSPVRELRLGISTLADVEQTLAARNERVVARRDGSLIVLETRGGTSEMRASIDSVHYALDPRGDVLTSIAIRTRHPGSAESAFAAITRGYLFRTRTVHWQRSSRVFKAPGMQISVSWEGPVLLEVYGYVD